MIKRGLSILCGIITLSLSNGCSEPFEKEKLDAYSQNQLNIWNKIVTDVMVKDIFSPPVASRIYVYPNIAAYEILRHTDRSYPSLAKSIDHFNTIPEPQKEKEYSYPVAAIVAYSLVAENLVYSFEILQENRKEYLEKIKSFGLSEEVLKNSIEYGEIVAVHIKNWAEQDGYKSRNNQSQIIKDMGDGTWKPTPPDFLEPIEPNWNKLRTFIIDSAAQFIVGKSTDFDTDPNSQFYKECLEVYNAVKHTTKEQTAMANFWDCNPNASYHSGHVMKFVQKISPGAHWMLIASHVSHKKKLNLLERSRVFTSVSITLADSFISCWNEKYETVVIRPETYINTYIDENWRPILQTPPFPEYTSGHSVVSGASATILSKMLGAQTKFTDSTEVEFGLPARSFSSFEAAAEEAAISRLYGGIHYMPAITNGSLQGKLIANHIANKLFIKTLDD